MPGSNIVCANLVAWQFRKITALKRILNTHIQHSLDFAITNHPWSNQSGAALAGLQTRVDVSSNEIVATLGGADIHNWYLENPLDCIFPYGNRYATPFGSRFRIIEMAVKENWSLTLSECQFIMELF